MNLAGKGLIVLLITLSPSGWAQQKGDLIKFANRLQYETAAFLIETNTGLGPGVVQEKIGRPQETVPDELIKRLEENVGKDNADLAGVIATKVNLVLSLPFGQSVYANRCKAIRDTCLNETMQAIDNKRKQQHYLLLNNRLNDLVEIAVSGSSKVAGQSTDLLLGEANVGFEDQVKAELRVQNGYFFLLGGVLAFLLVVMAIIWRLLNKKIEGMSYREAHSLPNEDNAVAELPPNVEKEKNHKRETLEDELDSVKEQFETLKTELEGLKEVIKQLSAEEKELGADKKDSENKIVKVAEGNRESVDLKGKVKKKVEENTEVKYNSSPDPKAAFFVDSNMTNAQNNDSRYVFRFSDDKTTADFEPVSNPKITAQMIANSRAELLPVCIIKGGENGKVIETLKAGRVRRNNGKWELTDKCLIQIS